MSHPSLPFVLLAAMLAASPAMAQGLANPVPGVPAPTLPGAAPGPEGPVGGIVGYGSRGAGAGVSPAPPVSAGGLVPQTGVYVGTDLAPTPGSAVPYTCPAEHGGRTIASSDVYDGPPMTGRLVLQSGGAWHLKPQNWPGNAYYISCEYGVDRPPLGVRLPARIRECKRPLGSTKQVVCR